MKRFGRAHKKSKFVKREYLLGDPILFPQEMGWCMQQDEPADAICAIQASAREVKDPDQLLIPEI